MRTLVAVGTVSDSSMFAARVLGRPRSGVTTSSRASAVVPGSAFGACAGTGWGAAGRVVVFATGCAPTTGMGAVSGRASAVGVDAAGFACDGSAGFAGAAVAVFACAGFASAGAAAEASCCVFSYASSTGHHDRSTESRSFANWSYISATSHSLAPKSPSVEVPTPVA